MSEDQDLLKQLRDETERRIKKMTSDMPLDFSNLKDYLVASADAMRRIAEHGLQHIPMSCYRNATHDQIAEDMLTAYGVVSTAVVLAMNMLPGEKKDQFRELLCAQLRQDLNEEIQRRADEAKSGGMGLADMLMQFLSPGSRSHGGGHGGGNPGSTH